MGFVYPILEFDKKEYDIKEPSYKFAYLALFSILIPVISLIYNIFANNTKLGSITLTISGFFLLISLFFIHKQRNVNPSKLSVLTMFVAIVYIIVAVYFYFFYR